MGELSSILFEMCLRLGIAHPDYLLARLTWEQLTDWVAWWQLQPFGEDRSDRRSEVLQWAVLAPHIEREHRPPPLFTRWPYERSDLDNIDLDGSLLVIERMKESERG